MSQARYKLQCRATGCPLDLPLLDSRDGYRSQKIEANFNTFFNGKKPDLLVCPTAASKNSGGSKEIAIPSSVPDNQAVDHGGPTTMHKLPGAANDPTTGGRLFSSYGMNVWAYKANAVRQSRPIAEYYGNMSAPRRPTEAPLMMDAMWRGGGPMTTIANKHDRPAFNGEWINSNKDMMHFAMHRHAKGVNVTFFDGSTRHVRAKKLWELQWHRNYDVTFSTKQGVFYFPAGEPSANSPSAC